jgi:hypothetical protein
MGLSSIVDNPYFSFMCWIIYIRHIHSQLTSWIAIIYAWFDKVATNICLTDLQEIIVGK